jgi:hypothetical protein
LKIYSDDPNLSYKTTKLKALYTKSEIDGLFAKWVVKDVFWHWDPEHNDVYVLFKIAEEIDGKTLEVPAKVEAPTIWDHKTRSKTESVNWDISMRVMYWFIKSHLEAAYLLQSSKTAAFLPYIASKDGEKTLKDVIIPRINEVQELAALPTTSSTRKVILIRTSHVMRHYDLNDKVTGFSPNFFWRFSGPKCCRAQSNRQLNAEPAASRITGCIGFDCENRLLC